MANGINQIPFNEIPKDWAFHPEIGPFIRSLLEVLSQTRKRTGGDVDIINNVTEISSTNFYAQALIPSDGPEISLFDVPGEGQAESFFDGPSSGQSDELFLQLFEDDMLRGEQSSGNSTTATLLSGVTFTGTSEQNDYPDVMASCYADVAGTLYFDFSVNGTDWRTFPTTGFSVAAGIHEFHTAVKGPRFFRARFVNGSTGQTTFQLFIYYGQFRQSNAPLNQPVGLDADSIITRATFPWLDISRGLQTGISSILKFGRNDAVGTTLVPIAFGGVYQTPQAAAATTLRIKAGGHANDTAAGTGAREVTFEGLDENWNFVTEAVATAGALASSATTITFTRLLRFYVSASGTYSTSAAASHSGDIVAENGAGGTDWGTIDATTLVYGLSQSEIGAYSIPIGFTGYVKLRQLTVNSGKVIDLVFFSRGGADDTAAPYEANRAKSVLIGVDGGLIDNYSDTEVPYGPFQGPCDLGFMGRVGASTGDISVEFEIILVEE